MMDNGDAVRLATMLQHHVPFEPQPYACIAQALGMRDKDVMAHVERWTNEGVLREISAILEGGALGYESALVAAHVHSDALGAVARVVCEHPTVTHCYERDHAFNLWFTLAVPLEMGLEPTLGRLAVRVPGVRFHALPARAVYKIGVAFDVETRRNVSTAAVGKVRTVGVLDARSKGLFRALQRPLAVTERPFVELADAAEVGEGELLEFARAQLGRGVRRYVGTFRHRALGVRGNVMVAWRTDREREAGERLAEEPAVSHCYAREAMPGFPYTLYSMLHGPDVRACRATIEHLARITGCEDWVELVTLREFRKCRLRYFQPELDAWWAAAGEGDAECVVT